MYLRHAIRKKDGKVHRYWCLVRSVRVGRRVMQQVVAHLGELDEQGRVEARALARRLIGTPEQARLFDDGSEHLTVPVRLKGLRIERSRQFGDVYLALALWRGTGLEDLCARLLPIGKERIAWAKMAAVLVAARFCEPSSELHIAEDWYRRTALSDLLQLGDEEGGQQGSPLSRARSSSCTQGGPRSAFIAALRRAVCGPKRGAALRRHEHIF
jgi:hypothetical protein